MIKSSEDVSYYSNEGKYPTPVLGSPFPRRLQIHSTRLGVVHVPEHMEPIMTNTSLAFHRQNLTVKGPNKSEGGECV